jgi:hypothetical protein
MRLPYDRQGVLVRRVDDSSGLFVSILPGFLRRTVRYAKLGGGPSNLPYWSLTAS